MKKYTIYTLLACVCMIMQSCLFNEEDVFDDSSAQRAIASVEECKEILKGAENGWLMEYYTGFEGGYGGFNLLAKFDGSTVSMMSEMETSSFAVGEEAVSQYKVSSFQGTQLSFDGYNEMIHSFCEPNGFGDPGYAGDYEFIFRSATKDKIVLTGKKYGNTLVMTPLSVTQNRSDYVLQVAEMPLKAFLGTYELLINGQKVATVEQDVHTFVINRDEAVGTAKPVDAPFIYHANGLTLYQPITLNGVTMSQFTWDQEAMTYVCSDAGVDAKIVSVYPAGYKFYEDVLGAYKMKFGANNISVTLTEKEKGKTYTLKGLPVFDLVVNYNGKYGTIDIVYQYLGVYEGSEIYLCPWDSVEGYLTWTPGSGLTGVLRSESPLTYSFKDNGVYGSANSLLFYAFSGTPSSSTGLGSILQIPTPVLTKVN